MADTQRLTVTLQGPVRVTYHKQNGEWVATACQFDLIGVGDTREEALAELQEVVSVYVNEVLNARKPVQFFCPSDPEDWNRSSKEDYLVTFELTVPVTTRTMPPKIVPRIEDLRPFRSKITSSGLAPVAV